MANRYKSSILLALAAALTLGLFAGCSGDMEEGEGPLPDLPESSDSQPEYYAADDIFSLNCNKEFSFNPFTTTNASNILCTQVMYDMLIRVDQNFACSPSIVSSWESDNGINWRFKVDTSVKFWDGTNLTATDASYSIQRAMRSPQFKARLKNIMGVSAVSEDEFIVTLTFADMLFPALLDIPVIKNNTVGDFVPMGTGPYVPDTELTKLTAFPDHKYASTLPVDTIYLKEYKANDEIITAFEDSLIDLVTNDPTGFFNLGYGAANDIRQYPTTNMHYLGFNSKSSFFSNPLCRKAMTYVVDRENIVMNYLHGAGSAATLPMNPSCDLYNNAYSELISYSVKKGEEAFDEAEVQDYDDDGIREIMITGIPVETEIKFIVCNDSAVKVGAARDIASKLTDMGINVNLRELSWDDYMYALAQGNFDVFYAETKLAADFSIRELVLSGGALNYGKFADSVLEGYISDYLSASEADRKRAADFMFKYITDTAPIVPICFEKMQVITHRGIISGLKPTQYNVFYGIEEWEIKLK